MRRLKKILFICLAVSMMLGSTTQAFALESNIINYIDANAPIYDRNGNVVRPGNENWTNEISSYFSMANEPGKKALTVTDNINGKTYSTTYYYNDYESDNISRAVAYVSESDKAQKKVTDITDGLNVAADTNTATQMMKGFIPIISLTLGVIVIAITLGMAIFSSVDLCYIAFPVFRNRMDGARSGGGSPGISRIATKQGADGSTQLRFVTDDAQYAVQTATIESGKSPYAIYLKKRVVSYIILAILLFILLTGNISVLTNLALRLVEGVLDIISRI